ncbi:hypothetical protein [Ulvibacterium marinum]|uniref:Uncharacterized protein n=1 Tax=Ulvibacterium marinum TaxID=2419782 RepID=A0A3B0C2L0_9FLAO|nr:hypothetical protein [Ulvibacterium marinum]RKN77977.1 hypothetical protein D7Z94_22430 [Ulvibacterium marinum]
MRKRIVLPVLLFSIVFSCTKDAIVEDDPFNVVKVKSGIKVDPSEISKVKNWYENEMSTRSNVITENSIVWDWENAESIPEMTLRIKSLTSKSQKSTFRLEIRLDNNAPSSGIVYVSTPFEGFVREVALNLEGNIIEVKKLVESVSVQPRGLLPTTTSFSEPEDGTSWTWDYDIGAWALPGVTVTFHRNSLNNANSYSSVNWATVSYYTNNFYRSGGYYNHTYSYTSSGGYSVTNVNNNWDGEAIMDVLGPDFPIANMTEFFECLNTSQNAVITVYADQPKKGSSAPSHGTNVGHAFVGIHQGSTSAVFGFYPEKDGPKSLYGPSRMGNNGGDAYDVSISVTVSGSTLQTIMNAAINYDSVYDINLYNCTNFAREIGNLAGMDIDDAWGAYPGVVFQGGENPGQLGENIRGMSSGNGVTINTTGGNAPSRSAGCP